MKVGWKGHSEDLTSLNICQTRVENNRRGQTIWDQWEFNCCCHTFVNFLLEYEVVGCQNCTLCW